MTSFPGKIEHIGIAVRSLDSAIHKYEQLLGTPCYKRETVALENVETAFFQVGDSKIELLTPVHPDSPVTRFLNKRGEGMHHLAFAVDNIQSEMKRCVKEGFTLLNDQPKRGADNKWVVFLHPVDMHGVLIELCQEIPDLK